MDSYEYYLLYHKDSRLFINAIRNDVEIIKSLERLISNKKLIFETEKHEVFQKIWILIQEPNTDSQLDRIFEALLTIERTETVKYWVIANMKNFEKSETNVLLRVTMILVKKLASQSSSSSSFLTEISNHLIDIMLRDSPHHADVLQILNFMLEKNPETRKEILDCVVSKCQGRSDRHALQFLCNFFDKICEGGVVMNMNDALQKFFKNSDPTAQQQGVFLIRTLVHRQKLKANDEDSFKKFTIILETLEQNQSHLILPSLTLVKSLNFSKSFEDFWFILIRMILGHENSLIRNWGLNFISEFKDHQFNNEEIVTILSAFNAAYLYDPDLKPISLQSLRAFVGRNWKNVFNNMTQINWMSVPCFKILEVVTETAAFQNPTSFDSKLIDVLLKQTEAIPKRITNLVLRLGVRRLFAKFSTSLVQHVGFRPLISVLKNIFNIGDDFKYHSECLRFAQQEDCELIFNDENPEDFMQLALLSMMNDKSIDEMKIACRKLRNPESVILKTLCKLNVEKQREKEIISVLYEVSAKISTQADNLDDQTLQRYSEILDVGLRALKSPIELELQSLLINIWKKLKTSTRTHFCVLKAILEFNFDFDVSVIESEVFVENQGQSLSTTILLCQFLMLEQGSKLDGMKLKKFLESFEYFVDQCYKTEDILTSCDIMQRIVNSDNKTIRESPHILLRIADLVLERVLSSDDKTEFVEQLINIFLALAETSIDSSNHVTDNLILLMEKLSVHDKARAFHEILKYMKTSTVFEEPGMLRDWLRQLLVDKLLETEILTKEQQIEMMTSCEIEKESAKMPGNYLTINEKLRQRLNAAQTLAKSFKNEYVDIIESYMESFSKASKKKPRYFPNSWIHRMKLHCLQPILFCNGDLTQRTIEILVEELLTINNQLNVSILIEIILSRHNPSIVEILKDDKVVAKLKTPALKSIFVIAVMQMRMEDSFTLLAEKFFGIAEMKLEAIHDLIIPFTMGQNYSVRSYAQTAIIILYKHVKSLFGARESQIMSKIDRSCKIIIESMKFKNAAKFFEVLKQDFRFTVKFDKIWSVESFYYFIPVASKMPVEEVTLMEGVTLDKSSYFKIAEMENETESVVMTDELSVPNVEKSSSASVTLQQKYLPYKYQIPGDKLMSTLPNIFEDDDGHLNLRLRSNLTVVASLINRPQNLGGLARTCEIFGTENYVIESLKLTENSDFKALSKTAEKWLKISEVKPWQLFDYLLGMKQRGYSIVGAEQSGKSVSLVNVAIPQKSVLLLGNEKEGIPADLLSLLDIIIEIPQQGVLRSLNVHVTGGIVVWEYAKQHLFKQNL